MTGPTVANGDTPPGPCAGLRVVDFSSVVSGPLCTQILGDLGADVVKVEALHGDFSRLAGGTPHAGLTGFFAQLNRNKRSLAVDLKTDAGREVARDLAAGADVVVENFRPGVSDRLGIGCDDLRARNPRLVYVAISGFGPTGPYADHPAYDHIIQALTGFMPIQGGDGPPRMIQSVVADKAAAHTATWAVLAALLARERSGRGQRIDVPMFDAYAAQMLTEVLGPHSFADAPGDAVPSLFRSFETADGCVVGVASQDHQYAALCRALEREDLIGDPRFATIAARFRNIEAFYALLESEIRKWSTAEFVERARRFGAPFAPVHDFAAFREDPQTAHNATLFEVADDRAGGIRYLRPPARFGETPAALRRHPPRLSEHAEEILGEAGYSPERVRALREEGVIL